MPDRTLEVWCFGELAGIVTDSPAGLSFTYADDWVGRQRPPLSQSLPLSGEFDIEASSAFFGGLLPEGVPRETLARQLGVSRENDFSLLAALAGDTAGAISLIRPGTAPLINDRAQDVTWLTDAELEVEIRELPSRPMHIDDDGEYRLSLAGAQDKLPVILGRDGRVGLTRGGAPSTHIMKTPIPSLGQSVANEAMCLDIGRRLGIPTVAAIPRRVGNEECLLVERYDREAHAGGRVDRLHQEDFCQALGVPTARKYQAEGGPTLADCFDLVRRASTVPARDAVRLFDYVVLSYLVANHDAHGKNYSLVYALGGTALAPAYDILSTFVYRGALRVSRKMAMSIGREYRPDWVRTRHFDQLLAVTGLAPSAARKRVADMAEQAPGEADWARSALAADGWGGPVLDRIVDMVSVRAGLLKAVVNVSPSQSARGASTAGRALSELPQAIVEIDSAIDPATAAVEELATASQRFASALVESAGQPSRRLQEIVGQLDEAVDEVVDRISDFSEAIWGAIGGLEDGTWEMGGGLDEVCAAWRQMAATIGPLSDRLSELTASIDRGATEDPVFRGLAAALGRLLAIRPMVFEWDARLHALGVPAPSATEASEAGVIP